MSQVQPHVVLLQHTPDPDKVVATAARLCYSDADIDALSDEMQSKDVSKFIERLLSMGHMSPFEHVSFTFGIEGVSRSLLAQITRHRIASFSVKSQRYVSANRDGETFGYIIPPAIEALGDQAVETYRAQMAQMQTWYNDWQQRLGGNCESANQDARCVLPNAAETKMIVTMNARELMHFFHLRCCTRAQWEIRAVAWEMLGAVLKVAPALFRNSGPSCVSGACTEGAKSCGKAAQMRARQQQLLHS